METFNSKKCGNCFLLRDNKCGTLGEVGILRDLVAARNRANLGPIPVDCQLGIKTGVTTKEVMIEDRIAND